MCALTGCFVSLTAVSPPITVINLSSVVLARCLFLPSLAPHNAPTNNTNASGVSDGAVLSGMGTGKKSLSVFHSFHFPFNIKHFFFFYNSSLHLCFIEGACLDF